MAVFLGSDESFQLRNAAVPDSAGISKEAIDALPPLVRNLRCGEQFEHGDPYCSGEKFSNDTCTERAMKTKYHPGL